MRCGESFRRRWPIYLEFRGWVCQETLCDRSSVTFDLRQCAFVEPMPANPGVIFATAVNPTTALTSITSTGAQVELDVGITTVTVSVTAQDGATQTYTVRITRADQ